jgi:hypothetical protein
MISVGKTKCMIILLKYVMRAKCVRKTEEVINWNVKEGLLYSTLLRVPVFSVVAAF